MLTANIGCGDHLWGEIRIDRDRKARAANVLADAQALPFRDQTFHDVHCISVLEHIPNWRQALAEILRVAAYRVIIEVPVNSDLRKTEPFRLLLPTPGNLKLFLSTPERARATFWQFDPEKLIPYFSPNFRCNCYKIMQPYHGMPSRCWRCIAWRI